MCAPHRGPVKLSRLLNHLLLISILLPISLAAIGCGSGSSASTPSPVAAAPTFAPAAGTYTSAQTVSLADATIGATIFYTTDGSTPTTSSKIYTTPIPISTSTTLQAVASAPGASLSSPTSAAYTIALPAATPSFSLAAGTYTSAQTVSLADATAGATIFYTTDGSAPTASSKTYTAPIAISTTTTLQAVASAPGASLSGLASAVYTITPLPAAPTFSPAAGTYTSVQTVSLSASATGASIFYTADGSTPSASSTRYTAPISVSTSQIVKAVTSLNGQLSAIAAASYVIQLPPASLTVSSGSNQNTEVGNGFSSPLQVLVLDANNKPVPGTSVSFTAPASGPAVTFSSMSCTSDSNGLCTVTARANTSVGTYTVTASTAALTAPFTLTNTGLHSYVVTAFTDTTAGVASNCLDQPSNAGSANSNCSLRDAIAAAQATATSTQTATITFAQTSPKTITLVHGSLAIPSNTTIQGATSGSGTTLTNLTTIDGNNLATVFTEAANVQATLINLVITHGYAAQLGGGVYMFGTLSINNSTFLANQAVSSGGAISNNGGTLNIFGSTFQGNISQASAGFGGGIDNFANGTVNLSNSTLTGNQAYEGGALYSNGTASITDTTIAGNLATFGGGVYNNNVNMTVTNSILNGDGAEECGGLYCAPLYVYVLFGSATPTPVDQSTINIAFSDSLGNTFSQTVSYGPFSSPTSLASAFGPYFYENFSGLDTTSITGKAFGGLLVISPLNGATLSPLTITNPGKSFTATQQFYPYLLSVGNNVYGLSATQINLAPLANNGGPTQTMLPLSGSKALCVLSPSTATGTDQRGQPRTATVGATTCQDAGAVQTSN